jgi:cytochrome c oxidase subunit II
MATVPKASPPKGQGNLNLIGLIGFAIAIVIGGLVIGMITPSIFPVQGSAEAVQVDNLFRFMLVIGGAIFLLVEGVLLFSVIRYRRKPGDVADGPPVHGNTTLEFVWTLVPAIIVIILTVYAYVVWVDIRTIKPNEQTVDAVGVRFAWAFNYSITEEDLPPFVAISSLPFDVQTSLTDGTLNFTSPQLHTWVNQPVHVTLRTEDVNHAFWIPGMRVKQDLLAGRVTDIRFTPIEPGVYRIVCAELCGSGHGNMAGEVTQRGELSGAWLIVHPDEETFLREFYYPEQQTRLFPPEDPALLGRILIQNYPCSGCHRLSELGWQGVTGPSLDGIASRTQRLAATGTATMEEYLYLAIRNPGAYLVPGYQNLMPAFNPDPGQPNYMPENELEAIIAYLMTQT